MVHDSDTAEAGRLARGLVFLGDTGLSSRPAALYCFGDGRYATDPDGTRHYQLSDLRKLGSCEDQTARSFLSGCYPLPP